MPSPGVFYGIIVLLRDVALALLAAASVLTFVHIPLFVWLLLERGRPPKVAE